MDVEHVGRVEYVIKLAKGASGFFHPNCEVPFDVHSLPVVPML